MEILKKGIYLITLTLLITLGACGGGSSDSGGPAPIVIEPGLYNGNLTLTLTLDGETDTSTGEITVNVPSTTPPQQAVIAFREFSGSSSIGPNQEFRIPSGRFNFPIGIDGVNCTMVLVFEGRFIGQTATGTAEGMVNCNPGNVVIDVTGTFDVSLGQAKQAPSDGAIEAALGQILLNRLAG